MILAIDIGGTKFLAGAVDDDGSVVTQARVATPPGGTEEELWRTLVGLLERVPGDFAAIGVGCGGPMVGRGDAVSPLNIPGWRQFPLHRRLAEWSGLPVEVDNDAKALVVGEWWQGSLRRRTSVMAMVVSTGVGGGLILDGRLVDGTSGQAGHVGHVMVEPGGRPCACGARGCLEAEIRGPSLEEQAGGPPPFPTDLLERAGTLLGRALTSVGALCDVDAVAVGGGVADGAGDALLDPARAEVARSFRIFGRGLDVVPTSAGALVGAAGVYLLRSGAL